MAIKQKDSVVFVGFSDQEDLPDNSNALIVGDTYEVHEVHEEEGYDPSYILSADNPDFNPDKRKSKNNPATVLVAVFEDEIKLLTDAEIEAEELEESDGEEATTAELSPIEYPDLKKKMEVHVVQDGGVVASGVITTKRKTGVTVEGEDDSQTFKPDSVEFYEGLAELSPPMGREEAKEEEDAQEEVETEEGETLEADAEIDLSKDPELKNVIILEKGEEDADILAMIDESEDLLELAHDLSEESASVDYRLGGILYHVRISGAYRKLDKAYAEKGGFALYVEQNLAVGYRKAMYLIDIYTKWNKFGLDPKKVQQIGWTKAQEIARVMDEDNAEELVAMAEGSSVSEIKETIRHAKSGDGSLSDATKYVTFKFRLTDADATVVRSYFEDAKKALDMEHDADVFSQIVTEWATEHLNIKKVSTKKKSVAKKVTKKATKKAASRKASTTKVAA